MHSRNHRNQHKNLTKMKKDQNSLSLSASWVKEKIFNRVFKLVSQMLALKDKNPRGLFSTMTIEY